MGFSKPRGVREVFENVFFVRGKTYDLNDEFLREYLRGSTKVAHLWFFRVKTGMYQCLLSREEQDKALGYFFEGDRLSFVFSRGMLRVLLGYYLDKAPEKISLRTDIGGKTVLGEAPRLRFSLSHTGDVVAYAFTNVEDVGVDIEMLRDVANMEAIAEKFLSERDFIRFLNMPFSGRRRLFFRAWTAREACFKAYGGSLGDYLVAFEGGDPRFIFVIRNGVSLTSKRHHLFVDDHCLTAVF